MTLLSLVGEASPANALGSLWPIILMFVVFYFLVFGPMRKQEKARKERLAKLERGDQVILAGGILGRISNPEAGEGIAMVEIADKVKIKVLRKEIVDKQQVAEAKKSENQPAADKKSTSSSTSPTSVETKAT